MPKRIYALAKELAMDSKDLVDLCTKIGIANKGSALASLEDDEVQRIESHLSGASASSDTAAKEKTDSSVRIAAPVRPSAGPLGERGRPRSLDAPSKKPEVQEQQEDQESETPVEEAAEEPVEEAEEVGAAEIQGEKETVAVPPADSPEEELETARSISRDDYIRPTGGGGRVRSLDSRKQGTGKPDAGDKKPQKRDPIIKVARVPQANQPKQKSKSTEPPAQQPVVRFTKDDISGQKQGMKASVEQKLDDSKKGGRKPAATAGASGGGGGGGGGAGGLKNFKDAADRAKGRRHKDDDEDGEGRKKGSGIAANRAERRRRNNRGSLDGDDDNRRSRPNRHLVRKGTNTAAPRKENAVLELPCTVRSFSEAAGVPAGSVIGTLMKMGQGVTINSNLDAELAEMIATELGVELEFRQPQTLEEGVIEAIEDQEDAPENLDSRPPIVTFLGHVDHGKTSLLDYLIGTRIVTGEAGGITQHIRAYQVEKDDRVISFVDTPGHEAFTEMRARGANVTDIAVLVVAADDGIMPQTEEAISHAKAAEVPIVVALNKCDLEGVDENRVLTQMTEHGLTPSEWGGDVEVVRTSAITGQGMDELLETLLTVAELHEYKANPERAGIGVCLEAEQQADKGVIAKVMVQNGSLKVGDVVLCGSSYGRVKAIYDTLDIRQTIEVAGPSMPVNITGLDAAPGAGDRFYVLEDIAQARELAESRSDVSRTETLSGSTTKVDFDTFQQRLQDGALSQHEEIVELRLIVRADVRGSLEAIEKELGKLDHPEIEIKLLQKSVGGISVADVTLASASEAVIVGFNVIPDENARSLADDKNVEIRRYNIIYKLAEDIKAIVEGRLKPEERVVELGRAVVKTVFNISRVGAVAGCLVAHGAVERGCRIRVNREGRTIGDYALDSLKRHKDDVKEVPRGMECGIKLSGFNDLKPDDMLEAYRIEEIARTLD